MQINRKVRPEILDSVALLVLDAQDCFIETLYNKERFLKRAAFAIEAARSLKIHTLFTEQAPEKLGRTNSELFKLAKNPKVFAKHCFSALGAPGIERYLREKEIYHLLVVGLEVPVCVYQTGLQATDEDIDITFFSDCLGSRRQEDEAAVLNTLTRMGCQVLPSETIFYSLLADTHNPYFRPFTQIVKAFGAKDFNLQAYVANRPQPAQEETARQPSEQPPRPPAENDPSENASDAERRKGRRRGRRRGKGRNRETPEGHASQPAAPDSGPRPPETTPDKPSTQKAAPAEARRMPQPESIEQAAKPDSPPAKKPKKAAKKAARKTARKAAKKAAKRAAKKTAKKTPEPTETPRPE